MLVLAAAVQAQSVSVPAKLVMYPDQIVHNAKIVTMDNVDPLGPVGNIYQAMAIRGDALPSRGTLGHGEGQLRD